MTRVRSAGSAGSRRVAKCGGGGSGARLLGRLLLESGPMPQLLDRVFDPRGGAPLEFLAHPSLAFGNASLDVPKSTRPESTKPRW